MLTIEDLDSLIQIPEISFTIKTKLCIMKDQLELQNDVQRRSNDIRKRIAEVNKSSDKSK